KQQKSAHSPRQDSAFQHRVDRHGRPFGNRIPLPPARGQPLNNKIVPQAETVKHRGSSHPRDRPHPHHQSSSAASDIRRRLIGPPHASLSDAALESKHDQEESPPVLTMVDPPSRDAFYLKHMPHRQEEKHQLDMDFLMLPRSSLSLPE
ncbi:hypothetical protein HID58_006697, partial [Brassica napus]